MRKVENQYTNTCLRYNSDDYIHPDGSGSLTGVTIVVQVCHKDKEGTCLREFLR